MHKLILKIFALLKNIVYFIKIVMMFFLLLHLLYWIQNLTNGHYLWLTFFKPVLEFFVSIGKCVSDGAIDAFGALFEYKYFIAVCIYVGLFYLCNLIIMLLEQLEDKYDDAHRFIKKTQEKIYNTEFKVTQENIEKKYIEYKIFVSAKLKKKFTHQELGFNLDEQMKIMQEFLTEKTGVYPVKYRNGFLYSFNNFNLVDGVLTVFFKLIKSNSPLDYFINVQIVEDGNSICMEELNQLIDLMHENKITMLSNTAYRYKFNVGHKYGTSQLGLFQKGKDMLEVHEFIEI